MVQRAQGGLETGSGLADDPVARDDAMVEVDLAGGRALDPHLAFLRPHREAGIVLVHDERGDATGAGRRVGHRHHRVVGGHPGVGDPALGPVQDPGVTVGDRTGLHGRGIRAGLAFGQGVGEHRRAAGHLGQHLLLQLLGRGQQQRHRAELVDRRDERGRRARPGHLLDDDHRRQAVRARPAVLLRDVHGVEARPDELVVDVGRELPGLVDLGGARGDPIVGQLADRRPQHQVFLGEPVQVEVRVQGHRSTLTAGGAGRK